MSKETYAQICASITPILEQRRNMAIYNIPPPRINIVSPYPQYSPFRLNMRRKAEILKYNSSQQNTKSNNPTKKQKFANLVKGSNSLSQQQINQTYTNLVCEADVIKPTLSTACNIPGPPIILQYEPNVPLYNYGNYKENRPYATTNKVSNAVYNAYTLNVIEYFNNVSSLTLNRDALNTENYTYTGNLGTILIGDNLKDTIYSFSISTPIAVWFYCIPPESQSNNNISLEITITSITANVYYNDVFITSINSNDINQPGFNPITVSCKISTMTYLSHAIQYVGMLNLNNLILQTPPQTIYNIKYVANYYYNNSVVNNYVRFIQTGVFANLQSANEEGYISNCVLDSISPNNFRESSFSQFIVS